MSSFDKRADDWLHLVSTLTDATQQLERLAVGDITRWPSIIKHQIYPIIEQARDCARAWHTLGHNIEEATKDDPQTLP